MSVDDFIAQLNRIGTSPLKHASILRELVEAALRTDRVSSLLDAAFHAKFLIKAQEVMRRIGPKGEGYDKLAAEFQSSAMKAGEHLRTVVAGTPLAERLEADFLVLDHGRFGDFLALASDLARLKNWEVDGKPLPSLDSSDATPSSPMTGEAQDGGILFQLASLLTVLILALIALEPPVSTFGMITAGAAILVSVVLAFQLYKRNAALKKGTP